MRKMLMAVPVAAALAVFLLSGGAVAMTPAAPAQLGLAGSDLTTAQTVSWHRRWHTHNWGARDHWGCRWYWGWPVPSSELDIRHRWRSWHHHHHHWHHR
jgi:hypothetical protein